jgi:hypothetical protein
VNEEEAYLVAGAFYNQVVLAICHMKVVTFYPLEVYSFIMFGITDLRITYYKLQYKNMSNVLNS